MTTQDRRIRQARLPTTPTWNQETRLTELPDGLLSVSCLNLTEHSIAKLWKFQGSLVVPVFTCFKPCLKLFNASLNNYIYVQPGEFEYSCDAFGPYVGPIPSMLKDKLLSISMPRTHQGASLTKLNLIVPD